MYSRSMVKEGKGAVMVDAHTLTVTLGLGCMFFGLSTLNSKAAIRPTWVSRFKLLLLFGGPVISLSAGALSVASQ